MLEQHTQHMVSLYKIMLKTARLLLKSSHNLIQNLDLLTFVPKPNPVYYAKEKVEPTLTVSLIETTKLQSSKTSARSDTLWIVCRFQCQHEPQTLSGWSGWVSQTSDLCRSSTKPSTVRYLPSILEPITLHPLSKCLLINT